MKRLYVILKSLETKVTRGNKLLKASTLTEVLVTMVVSGSLIFALYEGIVSLPRMFRRRSPADSMRKYHPLKPLISFVCVRTVWLLRQKEWSPFGMVAHQTHLRLIIPTHSSALWADLSRR